jgi:hypothetical protein
MRPLRWWPVVASSSPPLLNLLPSRKLAVAVGQHAHERLTDLVQ